MEARLSFDDKHEIIYTYAADGRKLRAEYRINNFAVVDRDDEFGEMDDIGLPLSDVATFGLRDTMVAGGGIIDHPYIPPFTTLTTRDYCGNYIYRNGTLERILTPTGYIEGDTLHHYIKDYQGNVRCVVRHDGTLVESNEYYPYGGLFSATASTQPYKYGAKELDRTNGLDLYDSEARWYDSLLGRTTTMDPLAEKYYSLSPYLWCAGNPVKFVDKVGKQPVKYIDDNGVKHIDWSIVVMVKALSPYASEKTIAKHERYKNDIRKELDAEFNSYLNGDGDGVKNGDGDIVISSFNIYVIDVDNTSSRKIADDLSVIYGQEIKDNQPGKHGKAAVFMSGNTNGAFGLTKKATYITISNGAPNGTKSHELYHTTGVLDNGYDKGGILNSPPEKISSDEVDMMWNLIPLKK